MITAHDYLAGLQSRGASQFATTRLATDHAAVTSKVRRQRVVRTATTSVVAIGAVGAIAFAAANITQPDGIADPAVTFATLPPSESAAPNVMATVSVAKQERIENIARDLANAFDTTEEAAMDALVAALPAQANQFAEGWVVAGEYTFDADSELADAARTMVSTQVTSLYALGVPEDKWMQTVILGSIVQQEAPAGQSDQAAVARVLLNRLDAGLPLEIESPLAYYLHADTEKVGDDGWAVDTPYNTYMYPGLPPGAIGAPTQEAMNAAADPLDGDWLYFLRGEDGNVSFFTTFEDFAVAVDELHPGTGASD